MPVLLQFQVFHNFIKFVAGIRRLFAAHPNQYSRLSKSEPKKLASWLCQISPGATRFTCKQVLSINCNFCTPPRSYVFTLQGRPGWSILQENSREASSFSCTRISSTKCTFGIPLRSYGFSLEGRPEYTI